MHQYAKKLRKLGWNYQDLAKRWNKSKRTIARIASSPKQVHIDALNGLPCRAEVKDD